MNLKAFDFPAYELYKFNFPVDIIETLTPYSLLIVWINCSMVNGPLSVILSQVVNPNKNSLRLKKLSFQIPDGIALHGPNKIGS